MAFSYVWKANSLKLILKHGLYSSVCMYLYLYINACVFIDKEYLCKVQITDLILSEQKVLKWWGPECYSFFFFKEQLNCQNDFSIELMEISYLHVCKEIV